MADDTQVREGHRSLKDILHELVDAVDLNANHRADLHEAVDIHDDPEAQRAKDEEKADELDQQEADLQAKLDALKASRAPKAADTPASPVPAFTPAQPVTAPVQGA